VQTANTYIAVMQKRASCNLAFTIGGKAAPRLLPFTYYFPKIPLPIYFEVRGKK